MFEMKLEVENDGGVALMRFSHFLLLRYPRQSHLKSAHLYEREQHFGYNLWGKKKKKNLLGKQVAPCRRRHGFIRIQNKLFSYES